MARKPESVFQDRVKKDLATLKNVWFVKVQQRVIRGSPDFILCINGYFVALELKSSIKAKPTKLQAWMIEGILRANGAAYVINPENWPAIFNYLKSVSEDEYDATA
jgi:hypothetical protein